MKLSLKLKADASKSAVARAVQIAKAAGATEVAPLFAQPPLPELARYYSIDAGPADAKRIVAALKDAEGVEAVETAVKRRLITRAA